MNDRPRYHTVVDVNEDGSIRAVVTSLSPPTKGNWLEITDDPLCRQASNFPRQYMVRDGKCQKKATVTLVADQTVFPADGETVLRVRVDGLPPEVEEVRVRVRGQEAVIRAGEDIEITAEEQTLIKVEVVTPTLQAKPLFLLAQLPED